ncbi:MAG: hypothetical protein ACRED2_07265 [Methylocella sp.]
MRYDSAAMPAVVFTDHLRHRLTGKPAKFMCAIFWSAARIEGL